jgi:hypothetical protein
MKTRSVLLLLTTWACSSTVAFAQAPDAPRPGARRDRARRDGAPASPEQEAGFVSRMMQYDKNGDGKLQKDEVSDERITRLFVRCDADQDGVVTEEELVALERKEQETYGRGGGFGGPGGPGGPPGGFGGAPGRGPGGRAPLGGGMGFGPRPGEVLPPRLREELRLSAEQEEQIVALQKDVDEKLKSILTEEQHKRIAAMQEAGPGRGGPPGAGGPPGGFGGRGNREPGRAGNRPGGDRPRGPEDRPQQ